MGIEQAARAGHCGIQVRATRGCPGIPTVSPRPLLSQASLPASFPKLANPMYLPEPSPKSLLPAYSKLTVRTVDSRAHYLLLALKECSMLLKLFSL